MCIGDVLVSSFYTIHVIMLPADPLVLFGGNIWDNIWDKGKLITRDQGRFRVRVWV
jgi:hypothetical protein